MKVRFEIKGGFAYLPALNKPVNIDTNQVDTETAARLEHLITNSDFFNRPATISSVSRGGADYRTYTIEVEDGSRTHKVQMNDPVQDVDLQQLISFLVNMARSSNSN